MRRLIKAYLPAKRAAEKAAQRRQDEECLKAGLISPAELERANSILGDIKILGAKVGARKRVLVSSKS